MSERRTQLRIPRSITSAARANRNEPMKPHCMRRSPYANAEVATSRAKIQKTIMAVLALYLRPANLPSGGCNCPPDRGGPPRTGGQEQRDGDADERDEVSGAVRLPEQASDRLGQQDPVAQPSEPGAGTHDRVLGPRSLGLELGRSEVGHARRHQH